MMTFAPDARLIRLEIPDVLKVTGKGTYHESRINRQPANPVRVVA
jgi:hypothetical protein